MPELFTIPAMVEHVSVWEGCSAKQSCFGPDFSHKKILFLHRQMSPRDGGKQGDSSEMERVHGEEALRSERRSGVSVNSSTSTNCLTFMQRDTGVSRWAPGGNPWFLTPDSLAAWERWKPPLIIVNTQQSVIHEEGWDAPSLEDWVETSYCNRLLWKEDGGCPSHTKWHLKPHMLSLTSPI